MKKALPICFAALIALSTIPILAQKAETEPTTIIWASTASLPEPRAQHASVAYNGRIYVLGGWEHAGDNTVYYGSVNPDGTVDSWHGTTSLPERRSETVAVAYNDYIYVLGGQGPQPPYRIERDTVYYAPVNPDGTLGSWSTTTPLPEMQSGHGAFVWNGRIYVLGGWTGFSFRREAYFAEIQPDGTLGSWIVTSLLPEARGHTIAAVAHNGYAYALGGQGPDLTYKADVWYAKINQDGTLGSWFTTASMPIGLCGHGVAVVNDEIYVIGGYTHAASPPQRAEVYLASINPDGTLGDWGRDTDLALPIGIEPRAHLVQTPVWNNRIYVIGGDDETGTGTNTVYYTRTIGRVPLGRVVGLRWDSQKTASLPAAMTEFEAAVYNSVVYVVGGFNSSVPHPLLNTVLYGRITDNGDVEDWFYTTPIPSPNAHPGVVAYDGRLYLIGGLFNGNPTDKVFYTTINQAEGTLGPWAPTASLPKATKNHCFALWQNKIYVAGGGGGGAATADVYFAGINPDGTLDNWSSTSALPIGRESARAVVANNYLYVIGGGGPGGADTDTVYCAPIMSTGSLGTWQETTRLPEVMARHSAFTFQNNIFVFGGQQMNSGGESTTYLKTIFGAEIGPNGTLGTWFSYGSLPKKTGHHATVISRGYVYTIGGVGDPYGLTMTDAVYKQGLVWRSLTSCESADIDGSGTIGITDIAKAARHFGHHPEECPLDP